MSPFVQNLEIPYQPLCEIHQEQLKAYALAAKDHNPIHLDVEAARGAGLPGVIAHGMLIAGLLAERATQFIESRAPQGHFQLEKTHVRFRAMSLLDEKILSGGRVVEANEDSAEVELFAKNEAGEVKTLMRFYYTRAQA